jgi:hypothetical protein
MESGAFHLILETITSPRSSRKLQKDALSILRTIGLMRKETRGMLNSSHFFSRLILTLRSSPRDLITMLLRLLEVKIQPTSPSDLMLLLPIIFSQLSSTNPKEASYVTKCYEMLLRYVNIDEQPLVLFNSSAPSLFETFQIEVMLNLLKALENEKRERFQISAVDIFHRILVQNNCPVSGSVIPIVLIGLNSLLPIVISFSSRRGRVQNLKKICLSLSQIVMTCLRGLGQSPSEPQTPTRSWVEFIIDTGLVEILLRQSGLGEFASITDFVLEITHWTVQSNQSNDEIDDIGKHLLLDHLLNCGLLLYLVHLIANKYNPDGNKTKKRNKQQEELVSLFRTILTFEEKYSEEVKELKLSKSFEEYLLSGLCSDSNEKMEGVKKRNRNSMSGSVDAGSTGVDCDEGEDDDDDEIDTLEATDPWGERVKKKKSRLGDDEV